MRIREILEAKGNSVHCISAESSLAEVVDQLVQCNCGSLVVSDDGEMKGIITERDILRVTAARANSLAELKVTDHMSSPVITGTPQDEVPVIMGVMTSHRIRHLPIVEQGQLAGMISIGDVVKAQHDQLSVENHYLKSYISS